MWRKITCEMWLLVVVWVWLVCGNWLSLFRNWFLATLLQFSAKIWPDILCENCWLLPIWRRMRQLIWRSSFPQCKCTIRCSRVASLVVVLHLGFFGVKLPIPLTISQILANYAPQLYRQVLLWRVLAMGILSVCLSVCPSVRPSVRLSRPGGIPTTGEIETPGLHHMVAWSI